MGNWASIISKTNGNNDSPYEDRTHNSANEITAITPQGGSQYSVSHDDAGNLSQDGTNATTSRKFTYDFRNRLVQIKKLDNTVIATYRYDGLNRRVHRKVENSGALNQERVCLYDNWQVVEELKKSGENWPTDRQYMYGGGYIDETLVMDVNTDPESDNDCTDAGGSKRYLYCENNNFNVLALTDDTGAVKERYEYDPYGAVTVTVDDSSGNPYRFQGRRFDPEHNLYYFRNRTHYPTLGRFMQRDPLHRYVRETSVQQRHAEEMRGPALFEARHEANAVTETEALVSTNTYVYVRSRPTTLTDPGGLAAKPRTLNRLKDCAKEFMPKKATKSQLKQTVKCFKEYRKHGNKFKLLVCLAGLANPLDIACCFLAAGSETQLNPCTQKWVDQDLSRCYDCCQHVACKKVLTLVGAMWIGKWTSLCYCCCLSKASPKCAGQ